MLVLEQHSDTIWDFLFAECFCNPVFPTASAYRLYRHYSYSWPYIRPKFCIEFLKNKSIQLSESDLSKASWSLQSFPSCVHPLLLAGWLATLPAEISALIQPQPFSIVNKLYIEWIIYTPSNPSTHLRMYVLAANAMSSWSYVFPFTEAMTCVIYKDASIQYYSIHQIQKKDRDLRLGLNRKFTLLLSRNSKISNCKRSDWSLIKSAVCIINISYSYTFSELIFCWQLTNSVDFLNFSSICAYHNKFTTLWF